MGATQADPILTILIEKLADGNARIRDGAKKGIDLLAASPTVGPAAVGAHALRALPPKQKTAWRPILVRLEVLTNLVNDFGIGTGQGSSGLTADMVMGFMKTYGAYSHSNGDVRDGARNLTVAVQRHTGTQALDSYLQALRPKQMEEYKQAFEQAPPPGANPKKAAGGGGGDGGPGPRGGGGGGAGKQGGGGNHVAQAPGGKVNTSVNKAQDKWHEEDNAYQSPNKSQHQQQQQQKGAAGPGALAEAEAEDFTCSFCGVGDHTWNEDVLDLHYLKDCPLLAPCPACAQVTRESI